MRTILFLAVSVFVFSFLPIKEAQASISSTAGLWHFESTNEEWAVATIGPDYGDQLYYNLWIDVVIGDGVSGESDSAGCWEMYFCSYAQAEAMLPYDSNAEYELYSSNTVTVVPQEGGGYYDVYGYSSWSDSDPDFYYPFAFQFTGGGPNQPNYSYIPLGALFAFASGGSQHGPPHHLKAYSDVTTALLCGLERKWKFKVVDFEGRNAGRVPIKELFPGAEFDGCTSDEVLPTTCSRWYYDFAGLVEDVVRPGQNCAVAHCGFTIQYVKWQWCPGRGIANKTLATMLYQVYNDGILLNGSTNLSGQSIF